MTSAPLTLRYVPAQPWFQPSGDLAVDVPLAGPSVWRRAPPILAALAVIAWLALARRRPRVVAKREERAGPVSSGVAKIDVVRASNDARTGWSGRVVDAHDGSPIAGAHVSIERVGFDSATVVATTITNNAGRFEIRASDSAATEPLSSRRTGSANAPHGDELVIEAPLHTTLRQRPPHYGELEIAIVLRRRKVLERLVAWARMRGRPFDAKPEPTPGHVRRVAGNDLNAAKWADAVERAAFGSADVNAAIEAEVDRLYPAANAAASNDSFGSLPVKTEVDPPPAKRR
jgi:hypothetical protein